MIRNRSIRMMGMAILSTVGLAGVMVLGSASIAAAQPASTVSLSPDVVSATACAAGCNITVTWTHAHHTNAGSLVLVECNYGVYSGDPTACNQNPNNVDLPGGPWIPTDQHSNGSDVIQVTSGTVGDGTCNGGQVCAIILANLGTQAVIAGPTGFGLTP
jgi:predicted membrane-bound mannosyltransferase